MSDGRPHRRTDRPPTLKIGGLRVEIDTPRGMAQVVDDVSLEVWPGEIVGVIGESGSGKTMTALSILGLMPRRARIAAGAVELRGEAITRLPEAERRKLRGDRVAFIPQDALRALNPVLRVDMQVGEPCNIHRATPWEKAKQRAVELLTAVHLKEPEQRAREYAHQFSGGMQQRAMIAMGLALEPELLIADEPTTALDVTVQAQVLKLLREIRDSHGTAILFITHDLGVIAEICDWVYVMYAGAVLEQGPVDRLFAHPAHPYTQMLLRATPTVRTVQAELLSIPGQIPQPFDLPAGCRFADRCPHRFDRCTTEPPHLQVEEDHSARCWLLVEGTPSPLGGEGVGGEGYRAMQRAKTPDRGSAGATRPTMAPQTQGIATSLAGPYLAHADKPEPSHSSPAAPSPPAPSPPRGEGDKFLEHAPADCGLTPAKIVAV